ncbi:MAG: hypothetical protein ACLRFK_02925 [Alphaproteobacteria bacterium]
MDNENKSIINAGPSKKDKLLEEKEALEKEIRELSGVSSSQIRYKEARIKIIEKQLDLDKPKEGNSTDKDSQNEFLMKMMAQKGGMTA